MKNSADLRDLSVNELEAKLLDLRKDQFKLRMERANGVLEKKHRIGETRKNIARVKTFMSQKVQAS